MKKERTYRKLWKILEQKNISVEDLKSQLNDNDLIYRLMNNKYIPNEKLSQICKVLGCGDAADIMDELERKRYCITTLSGPALLKNYKVENDKDGNACIRYLIDDSDPRLKRMMIKSTDLYDESALLYQIRKVMKERDGRITDDVSFFSQLIFFVDFEALFSDSGEQIRSRTFTANELRPNSRVINNDYRLEQLFKNGIYINDINGKENHYIAFDKSSSMSRKGKISFVLKEIADKLQVPLNLGIDFSKIDLYPSKYYAYRGLYLSNARRVEDERFILDENSVIVVKDPTPFKAIRQKIITAREVPAAESMQAQMEIFESEKEFKDDCKVFDGEGIISAKYAKIINEACGFEGATSFQIRLPFSKGMLHQVDFHGFLKEFVGRESFMITDCFGIERDLMKAEVIIPVSMFKCQPWLKDHSEINRIEDPIKFYFDQFKIYDHAMYISNTDLIYGRSDYTKINYQILNTLDLSDKGFKDIIDRQLDNASHPLKYLEKDIKCYEPDEGNEDDESYADTGDFESAIRSYIKEKKDLFYEPRINNYLRSLSESLKQDCARGRLLVQGEIRYLSGDLLYFLTCLLKNGGEKDLAVQLEKDLLRNEHFFMPNKQFDKYGAWYPLFRNPHLSRNEQCLLSAWFENGKDKEKNLYNRYFGHLRGVIMLPQDSLAPQALGGADFDGDIVKIVFDESVVNAVKNGAYEYDEKNKRYERKLPIVVIPGLSGAQKEHLPMDEYVSYKVIKNTFANSVGRISNLSIRIGQMEYGRHDASDMKHNCAECTILTGLEIDAAKTGKHPELDSIFGYGDELRKASSFDYISKFKSYMEMLSKDKVRVYEGLITTSTKDGHTRYQLKRRKNDDDYLIDYTCSDDYRPIDKLPQFFFESMFSKVELDEDTLDDSERRSYFRFQDKKNWRSEVDQDLKAKVGAIALAYHRIDQIFSKVNRWERNKSVYGGYIRNILRYQYDYERFDEIMTCDINSLWDIMDNLKEPGKDKVQQLKDNNWAFLLKDQRKEVFERCFSDHSDELDIVYPIVGNCDFFGYNLIIYALEDAAGIAKEKEWEDYILTGYESVQSDAFKKKLSKVDKETYESIYAQLRDVMVKDATVKKTEKSAVAFDICKERIEKLFSEHYENKAGDHTEEMAKLLYSISGSAYPDGNGEFFWKILDYSYIKSLIDKKTESTLAEEQDA